MKTFMLFLLCSLTLSVLSGQTQKGKVLLGASTNISLSGVGSGSEFLSLGFSSIKYKESDDDADKLISLNLSPKVGYFVVDNLAIGLDLNTSFSRQSDGASDSKFINTLIGAGPFVRYYFAPKKIIPFVEVNSLFGSIKSKYEFENEDDEEFKTKLTSFGGGVGIAIPVGDKLCFDLLLGYNNITINEEDDGFISSDATVNSISLKLGFTVFLGGGTAN